MGNSVVEACVKLGEALLKQAQKIDHPAFRDAHNTVFVEVKVAPDLITVHVTGVVNTVADGRIITPKTARSQVLGSVVWGIGSVVWGIGLVVMVAGLKIVSPAFVREPNSITKPTLAVRHSFTISI